MSFKQSRLMTKLQTIVYTHWKIIQDSQNQKQTNTRCLAKLLKLKIVAKLSLTANLDIQNRLMAKKEILAILNLLKIVLEKYM